MGSKNYENESNLDVTFPTSIPVTLWAAQAERNNRLRFSPFLVPRRRVRFAPDSDQKCCAAANDVKCRSATNALIEIDSRLFFRRCEAVSITISVTNRSNQQHQLLPNRELQTGPRHSTFWHKTRYRDLLSAEAHPLPHYKLGLLL